MNVLFLIFSFLFLFAMTFYVQLENHGLSCSLERTYEKHAIATRKMNAKIESRVFTSLPGEYPEKEKREVQEGKKHRDPMERINPLCSRFNLWPLILEGKERHVERYQIAAHLLRTLYPGIFLRSHSEKEFLDLFLARAKQKGNKPFRLETLSFQNEELQHLYYQLLRSPAPFLDFFKAEEGSLRICLFHANLSMLSALFNRPAAEEIYRALHQKKPPLDNDQLLAICATCKSPPIPLKFLYVKRSRHPKKAEISLMEDSLRKKVYFEEGL